MYTVFLMLLPGDLSVPHYFSQRPRAKRPELSMTNNHLVVEATPRREISLSELKVAAEFDSLLRRLNIFTIDVQRVVHCVSTLGGLDSAMTIVEELRKLRKRPADQPSLCDGGGLSDLEDGYLEEESDSILM